MLEYSRLPIVLTAIRGDVLTLWCRLRVLDPCLWLLGLVGYWCGLMLLRKMGDTCIFRLLSLRRWSDSRCRMGVLMACLGLSLRLLGMRMGMMGARTLRERSRRRRLMAYPLDSLGPRLLGTRMDMMECRGARRLREISRLPVVINCIVAGGGHGLWAGSHDVGQRWRWRDGWVYHGISRVGFDFGLAGVKYVTGW
jgi:hypothetical protein